MNNLIQQLKQIPKWVEFEKWWDKEYSTVVKACNKYWDSDCNTHISIYLDFKAWCNFPFEFQAGVFRKFIESRNKWNSITVDYSNKKSISEPYKGNQYDFEWTFFNRNHDISISEDSDYCVQFDTFEELIIWYFNN